jgi:DNA helicase IV
MSIENEATEYIGSEETLLNTVLESLSEQRIKAARTVGEQSALARELTSEMIALTREEDKAQAASDEAVAHGLTAKALEQGKVLEQQIKEPYFARVELKEDTENGEKIIEYKLGKSANPDCRIIDWRKAPIAKLYYEYKEGDYYNENILGKDRCGEVLIKNSYEIRTSNLQKINCRLGSFLKEDGQWKKAGAGTALRGDYSGLPDILALITKEQFQSITRDFDTPVLIQGIAGSGKTAVALHRISYLLHEANSDYTSDDIIFVLKSPSLRSYIQNSLASLGHSDVKVYTFEEWLEKQPGQKRHLVIDEVQDFSEEELASLFAILKNTQSITLVGDRNQTLDQNPAFPGWHKIASKLGIAEGQGILNLKVSFRSTLQIMQLAEFILGDKITTSGRNGLVPIWFKCPSEDKGVQAAIHWLKSAQEKYPQALTAVICRTPAAARFLYSCLSPTFSHSVRLAEGGFDFSAGITVCTLAQVKGLEFFNTLIWDIADHNYGSDDYGRRLLYVAATRSEENLALISYRQPPQFMLKLSSNICRQFKVV